ncbi:hypothetical protein NPIL_659931 [Nephila pilipes]|uniref:Uncharacterized protein n=1 Tax=Nephila pilipes TaxID=299642 RepID=A0A8X6QI12_NEPPI|nr:hypothetical protein NPIL_659931 [Nephila pilipes]
MTISTSAEFSVRRCEQRKEEAIHVIGLSVRRPGLRKEQTLQVLSIGRRNTKEGDIIVCRIGRYPKRRSEAIKV